MDGSLTVPLRALAGPEAGRWRTFPHERTIAVLARTVTSVVRVLETLPAVLRGDPRVGVVFAHDPDSAFRDGVLGLLQDNDCRVLPLSRLAEARPDLILSASENVRAEGVPCPVLVLPHGIGFQKYVPGPGVDEVRVSGVVPDRLLETGRAWLAVSHPDQRAQLERAHPAAKGQTLLIGDPCLDDLRASGAHARFYRRELGVGGGQRLVVLSSTWGPESLLGSDPELPRRLLAQLPYDGYRVAAILHPNIWAAHGAWQIRTVLAPALDAGLLLMPPVHAWRPALVSGDLVIGDHGSVTLYGAALGKPTLLGAFGDREVVPGTAVARLGAAAPRLDRAAGLAGQVERALAGQAPDRYEGVVRAAFAHPGEAAARLRAAVYRFLDLSEPAAPPPRPAVPVANPPSTAVTSWWAVTSLAERDGLPEVGVRRHPAAALGDPPVTRPPHYTHLACLESEPDQRIVESASVVVRAEPAADTAEAGAWTGAALARLPGSRAAAVPLAPGGELLIALWDGRTVTVSCAAPVPDPGLTAAVVYTLLRAGGPLTGRATLRTGPGRIHALRLAVRGPVKAR